MQLWTPSALLVIDLLDDSSNFLNHLSSAGIYIAPVSFAKQVIFGANVGTMSRQGQDMAAPRHLD